jgi:hypothetical protein
MRVVAQQGIPGHKDGCTILVETRPDYGFVHDLGEEVRYEDFFIHSILARGYWENPTISLSDEELERISKLPIKF